MCKEINLKKIFADVLLVSMVLLFNFGIFAQSNFPVLELNNPVEEEIETGNSKSYSVRLEKNQYARFVSEQIGINSFIKIYDPDGKQIAEVAHFIERTKDNRVILVTDIAGNYRIEVIPAGKEKQSGKYKLTLEEIRDAVPQDQFIMNGQQALLEAEKLHAKGSAESRKEAVAKYEEALEYWQKSDDLPGQADTNSYLAVVLFSTGNLPKALEKTHQARDFYNKAGDYLSEATAYRGIGLIHHMMGELDEALEFYEKGLDINRRLKNYSGEADDLGNIGGVYQFRGEYQKAIDYYRNALEIMRKLPNGNNDARLLNNIGEVYRLLGENQKALDYLKEALKLRNANRRPTRTGEHTQQYRIGLSGTRRLSECRRAF